ncbi:MAG: DNA replication and repair protein RecF [Gemmatimonadota bacterium]
MRLVRLEVRGYRNLPDCELRVPEDGVVLLGANGQGKTNFLEAAYYPVLFRSFRGAGDSELVRFGESAFRVVAGFEVNGHARSASTTFITTGRKKRNEVDGTELERLANGAGAWLAVTFLPGDVTLASGPASERRYFLDRTLSLANTGYLRSLSRYRAALVQRNAALRQGRADLARAFDRPLSDSGAEVVMARLGWAGVAAARFTSEFAGLGEPSVARLSYHGNGALAERSAWPDELARASARDQARGMTTVGPHRDDLRLFLDDRAIRDFGSTGQQRSAAIALKLLELETLRDARGVQPALLLDDVFAELDRPRQLSLLARLRRGGGQVMITSPRADELPDDAGLTVWRVEGGRVHER